MIELGVHLNTLTVVAFADLYDVQYDVEIFAPEYGRRIRARGYLTVDELRSVMAWKYPPSKGWPEPDAELVHHLTVEAFTSANPVEAVARLDEIPRVGVRMASAILAVYDPERYTVLDWRAWASLKELGLLDPLGLSAHDTAMGYHLDIASTYGAYLRACLYLAADAGVSLRTLDRCLWAISEKGLHAWARRGITLGPLVCDQQALTGDMPRAAHTRA